MDRTTWLLVGIIGAAALIVVLFMTRGPGPQPVAVEPVVAEAPPVEEAPRAEPAPSVSETEPPVPTVPVVPAVELPALEESDEAARAVLAETFGGEPVESYLVPEQVVRKVVVTVDNLPADKVAMRLRAVAPVPGRFAAEGGPDEGYTLDPANYRRYEPLVDAFVAVAPDDLAAVYFRYYPLLQEAYEELGYPGRQFHARVIATIDDLLAAPAPAGPVELTRPKVLYEFADRRLESLSAGQKMLIRMGPVNAARVKARLGELRALLTGRAPGAAGGE